MSAVAGNAQASWVLPVALSFGLGIAVLVYGTAHISGGHLNPAVTFSVALRQNAVAPRVPLRCRADARRRRILELRAHHGRHGPTVASSCSR